MTKLVGMTVLNITVTILKIRKTSQCRCDYPTDVYLCNVLCSLSLEIRTQYQYCAYPAWGRRWGTRRCTGDRPHVPCCCPAASRPPSAAGRFGEPTWWSHDIGTAAPTQQCGHPRLWQNTPSNSCTEGFESTMRNVRRHNFYSSVKMLQ